MILSAPFFLLLVITKEPVGIGSHDEAQDGGRTRKGAG